MLKINIPEIELYDETKDEFITIEKQTLQLEHSLVSVSKWESKWKKSFLDSENKTFEETLDYVKCMTLTQNVNPLIYENLPSSVFEEIKNYISDPMSATTFSDQNRKVKKEIITAELIYYYMISLQIPFECQKWHLNRLLTLIKVCSIKNQPDKKMSKRDIYFQNRALNQARRKAHNTKG